MHTLDLQLRQQEYYRLVISCHFHAEIIRTTTNIAEQGLKELRHIKVNLQEVVMLHHTLLMQRQVKV